MLRQFALVFYDDILVYSTTWSDHLEYLNSIFSIFHANKIFEKCNKYALGSSSIAYLSHQISGRGVQVD